MKKLIYEIAGYSEVYNHETNEVEQQQILVGIEVENPTAADIEKAKEVAYNGEYAIEDDGQPEPVTEESRITELEEALDLLLSGVTE